MTKINVTKGQLINKHQEITQWKRSDSLIVHFFDSKIKEFYNHNRIRIESIINEIKELNQFYFEFEPDGNTIKVAGGKQVMREGYTMEEYKDVADKLMAQETVMVI